MNCPKTTYDCMGCVGCVRKYLPANDTDHTKLGEDFIRVIRVIAAHLFFPAYRSAPGRRGNCWGGGAEDLQAGGFGSLPVGRGSSPTWRDSGAAVLASFRALLEDPGVGFRHRPRWR